MRPGGETCMQTQFSVQVLTSLSSLSNLQGEKNGERSGRMGTVKVYRKSGIKLKLPSCAHLGDAEWL